MEGITLGERITAWNKIEKRGRKKEGGPKKKKFVKECEGFKKRKKVKGRLTVTSFGKILGGRKTRRGYGKTNSVRNR